MEIHEQTIDDMIGDVSFEARDKTYVKGKSITIWVPDEYKDKYDLLQARSNKVFGKKVKEIVKLAIDKVALD